MILSALYLATIYTPLKTIADLARVTFGQKYLLILANDAELRPSGGFIGSFAIIDARGIIPKVSRIETNVYTQDNLFESKSFVATPQPLEANLGKDKSWTLHDSNWDPDFPTAAQYIKWFYTQEYSDDIDGVILVNTKSVKRLLQYTGPIRNQDYEQDLSAENIYESLSNSVENDYWADPRNEEINQPKTVLAAYEPLLLKKTIALPLGQIIKFTRETLEGKEIVLWNRDSSRESLIQHNGWSGTVAGQHPFAAAINATVGTKTNHNLHDTLSIKYNSSSQDIEIIETRAQSAPAGSFGSGENISFAQIILPPSADYKSFVVNGTENVDKAYRENNNRFSSIGKWVKIDSAHPLSITAKAVLPKNTNKSFCLYKQIGSQNAEVVININDAIVYNGTLEKDICIGFNT